MKIEIGTAVRHATFGDGIVIFIQRDVAEVNFLNVGKKTVLISFLKAIGKKYETVDADEKTITNLDIVSFLVLYMSAHKLTKMKNNQCVQIIRDEYHFNIPADFIIQAINPILDTVFLKNLQERKSELFSNKSKNQYYKMAEKKIQKTFIFKPIQNIDAFERICIKEKFESTIKLFFAREIIRFVLSSKSSDPVHILRLKDVTESLLNVLLYQMSIGFFYNDIGRNNPRLYGSIYYYIQNNTLLSSNRAESFKLVDVYLRTLVINQFLIVNGEKCDEVYQLDEEGNLYFGRQFVTLLKKKGESLDKRIVNRIKYFLSKNNDSSPQLQHYLDFFNKDQYCTKDLILNFEYEGNLSRLSKELRDDLILKNDFKNLMKKYGIPTTEKYFKMCMARIDYTLRTKRIILKNKYKTLTAYYREQALKEDVYRYSNPHNLDEYDIALKSLNYNLDIIDVGYGVYITRTNMIRNGLTDEVILAFKEKVVKTVQKMKFISLQELMDFLKDDKVVSYCDGDKKQMVQFIKPIGEVGVNELASESYILSVKSSKHYKGDFIEFIIGTRASMDIYDIHDSVKEHFDVEYSVEEIIRDLKHTSLYYSEEMEKVYKTKKVFVLEVFGNGN